MKTQAWISLKKTSESNPKMHLWMNNDSCLILGGTCYVFNSDLQIIHSHRVACDSGYFNNELYYLKKDKVIRKGEIETVLKENVIYMNQFENELLTVSKNGSISSSKIQFEQKVKVLHASLVNETLGLIVKSKKTMVQFHTPAGMTEFEIELQENPVEFGIGSNCCFIKYQTKLVIQLQDKQFVYEIEPNSSICSLGDCVALIQQSGSKCELKVWDTKFGTLQHQQQVFEEANTGKKSFFIAKGTLAAYGDVLLLSICSKQGKVYTMECGLLPYHQEPVTLLESLGKLSAETLFDKETLSGTLTSVIPVLPPQQVNKTKPLKMWKRKVLEWNELDHQFVSQLITLKSEKEFQSVFVEWIFTKHSSLRNWSVTGVPKLKKSSANGTSLSLLHLPRTDFTRKAMETVIQYCFDKVWPRAVVEYLIHTGSVSCNMVDGFIEKLIELKELDLIKASLEHVMDLSERDFVTVLKFVTDPSFQNDFLKWKEIQDQKYQEKIQNENPHKIERLPETIMKRNQTEAEPSVLGVELNQGQREFIYFCFSTRFIHNDMARELVNLSTAQIHMVLEWTRGILAPAFDQDLTNKSPNQKFPLWWCWYDTPFDAPYASIYEQEFNKYNTAIDVLAVLMDSHLTTIKVSSDVQLILNELKSVVERDVRMLQLMETKLMGPLMATVLETKVKSDGYGKMWNRLVDHVNVGVGEYQVEVLEI